jgi:hypothetical protein
MNPTLNAENANEILKNHCSKHYQPLLKPEELSHPDFPSACMKCLRDCYLRRDEDNVRRQALADINDMQVQYQRIKEEFGIRANIKEEFCGFTSLRIKNFVKELDKKYESLRKRFEEHMQVKLI